MRLLLKMYYFHKIYGYIEFQKTSLEFDIVEANHGNTESYIHYTAKKAMQGEWFLRTAAIILDFTSNHQILMENFNAEIRKYGKFKSEQHFMKHGQWTLDYLEIFVKEMLFPNYDSQKLYQFFLTIKDEI